MGQKDGSFKIARKNLKEKILGITCHNSKVLANSQNADYIALVLNQTLANCCYWRKL